MFVEQNGILVIEAESIGTLPENWRDRSSSVTSEDIDNPGQASGGDFIVWEGDNHFSDPSNGVLTYEIEITTPGLYQFEWRSQVGQGTNTTEHNDTWLKINSDMFYGYEASSDTYVHPWFADEGTYPDGAEVVHGGFNRDGFIKVFSSKVDWTWSSKTNDGTFHDIFAEFDEAGVYEIQIAARSSHHAIDRLVLHHVDYGGDPYDLSLPQSEWVDDSVPPLPSPEPEPEPKGTTVYLVDVVSDARVAEITEGATLDAGLVESGRFSIEVVPGEDMTVGSVALSLNGAPPRIENVEPYALFGDHEGDFFGSSALTAGSKQLSIEVFEGERGTGASTRLEVSFAVEESPAPEPDGRLELGTTTITQADPDGWTRVEFDEAIPDAVVVMGPLSTRDGDPATLRVRNIDETGFEVKIEEWEYLDGIHGTETVSWMAATAGVHTLSDGTTIAAGSVTARDNAREGVDFGTTFSGEPAFFAQVASANGRQAVTIRTDDVTENGADVFMQEQESANQSHAPERVDWIAVAPGLSEAWEIRTLEVSDAPIAFAYDQSDPVIIAAMQTADGGDTATLRIDDHSPNTTQIYVSEET
ncbi:MAG: hypothetical protein AAGC57_21070, partial [Pseudomonadota bacterium]